jgi:hypothetical protein
MVAPEAKLGGVVLGGVLKGGQGQQTYQQLN